MAREYLYPSILALVLVAVLSGCGGGGAGAGGGSTVPGSRSFPLAGGALTVQAVNPADLKVFSFGPQFFGEGCFLAFWGTTIEVLGVNVEGPGSTQTVPLLFVRGGDIHQYVGPWFDKWQSRRLTNTAASESWPVWSQRADKIAYLRDNDVWVMNADGSSQTNLTNSAAVEEGRPEWSPDGTKIAFARRSRDTGLDIWIMNSDGTGQINVTATPGDEQDPTWMPNSRQIVYAARPLGGGDFDLWETNLDGSVKKNLSNTAGISEIQPMVDAYARAIVFVRPEVAVATHYHLWRWDLASNDFRLGSSLAASGPVRLTSGSHDNVNPTWDTSGEYILFASNRDGQMELYGMQEDGANQVNLTWLSSDEAMPYWKSYGWYHISIGPNGRDSGFNPPLGVSRAAALVAWGEHNGWFGSVGFSAPEGGMVSLAKVEPAGMVPLVDVTATTYLTMVEDRGRGVPRLLHLGNPADNPRIPGTIQRAIVAFAPQEATVVAVMPFAGAVLAPAQGQPPAPCTVVSQGSEVLLKGNFLGVEDAKAGKYIPGPLTEVVLAGDSGQVRAYR